MTTLPDGTDGARVLVTGATGFVGRALVARLSDAGFGVTATARHAPQTLPNRVRFTATPGAGTAADLTELVRGTAVVVHCAGRAHVLNETEADPLAAFRAVNVGFTLNLARQAAAAGVRRFVLVSSIGVCGAETFGNPFRYDDKPAPHSPYAVSKLEAEIALAGLAADTGLEVVIVRPPLIYGPNALGNFARLVKFAASGVPLPLGGIANRRDLIGLSNLTDILLLCATHPRAAAHIHNVCDGWPLSTTELIRALAAALDRTPLLLPVPAGLLRKGLEWAGRGGMAQQLLGSLQIDGAPSRQTLGWTPANTLEAELGRVAKAYQAQRSG